MVDVTTRRSLLTGLAETAAATLLPSQLWAAPLAKVKELGRLRVGVYRDNRPWSWGAGTDGSGVSQGIDVDLGKALAAHLGVAANVVEFMAGDDLAADFRNVVWRGGLLGFQPCDVMLHVPFDRQLMLKNDQVAILAPYYREGFAMLCGDVDDCEAPPVQFKGKRIAVEIETVSDAYMVGSFGGALRGDVHHYDTGYEAMSAVATGKADLSLGTRAQAEAVRHDQPAAALKRRKGPIPAMTSPGWDIAMAVKDNSRTLGDALETITADMIAKGQMTDLFAAHGVEWHAALAG